MAQVGDTTTQNWTRDENETHPRQAHLLGPIAYIGMEIEPAS